MTIHRYPCDPTGHVITDDSRVETLTFGSIGLLTGAGGKASRPEAAIELAQHTDGTWMWGISYCFADGCGGGYRVGPKWGKFADTRGEAIWAACRELKERIAAGQHTEELVNWLDELDGTVPVQQELFA